MTLNWARYVSATGCTKYGPAGPQAYTTYTEDVFQALHRSLGICNCRTVRGGASYSHHAECRAADSGFSIIQGLTFAYRYAVLLGEHGDRTGLDHIICNKQPWAGGRGQPIIFSRTSPNGRVYTGTHPHKDHNHTGFTRNAAKNLTYGTLVAIYGTPEEVAAKLLDGIPPPTGGSKLSLLPIQYGHGFTKPPSDSGLTGDQSYKKEDVKLLQKALGQSAPQDGVYGNGTAGDVKAQTSSVGGKRVGADEWEELNPGGEGTKGDKGDKGDTGATGMTGAKGDTGDQGDQGTDGQGLEPGTTFEIGQKATVL